jgi:hypothetical protein
VHRIPVVVVIVAVLGGCGSSHSSGPPTGDFVGRASRGDAFVAVVAGRANVVAYVCDGRRGVAALFTGSRSGDRVRLTNARGARLSATIARGRVTGTFAPASDGSSVRFAATPARRPAGFYRARGRVRGASATVGWVVLPDGSQRGSLTIGTKVLGAPALDTATSTTRLGEAGSVSAVRISTSGASQAGQIGQSFGFGG